MADVTMTLDEYLALVSGLAPSTRLVDIADDLTNYQRTIEASKPAPKKRKVSKYNREFGRQLKALKRKHPRSKISALMKRAHSLTKKALK